LKQHFHFKVHKPYGYLSQFVGEKATQKKLGELYPFPEGTMAIGRLDQDSEGLLLLTTDGKQSEWIRSRAIEKEYWAQLDGDISEFGLESLRLGVEIILENVKYQTIPCRVEKMTKTPDIQARSKKIRGNHHGPTSWISIVLTEGKFRQVRKMTAAVGFPTLRLIRVRIGEFHLGEMKQGEVEEVNGFFS
jgi:23S rRNA pseudouridine2457 synthase